MKKFILNRTIGEITASSILVISFFVWFSASTNTEALKDCQKSYTAAQCLGFLK